MAERPPLLVRRLGADRQLRLMVFVRDRHEATPLGARLDALADSLPPIAGLTGVRVFQRTLVVDNPRWLGLFCASLALAVAISRLRSGKLPAFPFTPSRRPMSV